MEENLPLVSIGLPVFNRPDGLRNSLECLVNQTYKNIEIIIADNCSPDPEVEKICREYEEKESRVSYYRHDSNKGWGYNTNFVIEKARGNYFMRATDDDVWDETFIEKIMLLMLKNSKVSMGFSNFIEIDENDEKSKQHLENHLPLLQAFAGKDQIQNIKNYINQFEGFGKSCLYFSIFKIELLRTEFVKNTLEKEVLAGDLLINLSCLLRGELVIVPEVLMKVRVGNEKQYDTHLYKTKILNLLFMTFDYEKFRSVRLKWFYYFKIQRKIINNSGLQLMSNLNCNLLITRRVLIFHYDLICMNSCTKGFDIFKVLKRKIILE